MFSSLKIWFLLYTSAWPTVKKDIKETTFRKTSLDVKVLRPTILKSLLDLVHISKLLINIYVTSDLIKLILANR